MKHGVKRLNNKYKHNKVKLHELRWIITGSWLPSCTLFSNSSHWRKRMPAGGTKPPKSDLGRGRLTLNSTHISSSTQTDSGHFINLTIMPYFKSQLWFEFFRITYYFIMGVYCIISFAGANQKEKGMGASDKVTELSQLRLQSISYRSSLWERDFQTDIWKMARN